MADKMTLIMLLVAALCVVGGVAYWFLQSKGDDVRKFDPGSQDRIKNQISSRPTVSKTAQLSALRERLADAQTSSTGLKKVVKNPADQAKVPEKSWRPEEAGLDDPTVLINSNRRGEDYKGASQKVDTLASHDAKGPSVKSQPQIVVMKSLVSQPEMAAVVENFTGVPKLPSLPVPSDVEQSQIIQIVKVPEPTVKVPELTVQEPSIPVKMMPAAEAPVHILLVDDSKVVRVKTEKLLVNKGYVVTTAVDGIDALAKLETLRPSIIITDIEMPNLDGFGLVRNVRGNLRTAEIPVIVMTSHVNLHLDIAATEGINGFLPKPFNDQDLLDQVAFLCES